MAVPSERRARDTRAALLEAARVVFAATGYADANVTDVVNRAGSSVGGLYHHFAGKADLYLALYDDYQSRQEERAAAAVRQARDDGVEDEAELFVAGARAYLEGCWENRDLAQLFLAGSGPPGFDLGFRRRFREWVRQNGILLGRERQRGGKALALVLTTVISEASREVAVQSSKRGARQLADDVLALIAGIAAQQPAAGASARR